MEQLIWEEEFRVRAYEVAPNGKATVLTIFNYLQEVAANHALQLKAGVQLLEPLHLTWVLSRARIQMERYPNWHEIVRVETWPSQKETYYGLRDFLIYDNRRTVIGRASSSWMMIDLRTRKPTKLPDFLDGLENKEKGRALDESFNHLPVLSDVENQHKFVVRYSDLDVNKHVNSGHYIDWAMEAVPKAIREKYEVSDLQVNYRAEALYGDRVISQIQAFRRKNGFEIFHRVLRENDNKELFRAISKWNVFPS